jgi:hypothetical protein
MTFQPNLIDELIIEGLARLVQVVDCSARARIF